MADALEEFARQTIAELLDKLPPEELRKHLSPEEPLEGLPPEERLKGLSMDGLLAALSPEKRQALLRLLKETDSSTPAE